ncbi:hypothetical protein CUJ86_01345 [Methanofollis fontis]|uniref:DUF47 family protein n=1 Tax=Methanofollis fontis TaxID=2052832 RepID=A0A483CQM2_9EURY|nr:hypothetical protein CUJ86_01345 [Methanofollis fontis]
MNAALVANGRVKYYFTLLQAAKAHADAPEEEWSGLRGEREAAGVENALLDQVVAGAERPGPDTYRIPAAAEIMAAVREAMVTMARPVLMGEEGDGALEARLSALLADLPAAENEILSGETIRRLTSGDRTAGDSLHLLVLDLHRRLNALQAGLASETIDGARASLLKDADRPLVAAFMAGLNRTASLKFDHPGLGTTATRTDDRLVIQNDIGLTDAHVLVIYVRDRRASVVYTDIHMPRLDFFRGLFEGWEMDWEDTRSRAAGEGFEKGTYLMTTGTYAARDGEDLQAFLRHLGSRLVFLIDWNRARKRLRYFLPRQDVLAVLGWAAENEIGHRAFLQLGGETLIYSALEVVGSTNMRYGEPLHRILGRENAVEFIKGVLRTAKEGLAERRSHLLIQDEIRADLARYFRSVHERLIDLCEEHATYVVEAATDLQASFLSVMSGADGEGLARSARRVKEWERSADGIVSSVRSLAERMNVSTFFAPLIGTMDDVIDALEQTSFYTSLPRSFEADAGVVAELASLAGIALEGSRELLRMVMAAGEFHQSGSRADMKPLLSSIDRLILLEEECDEALRGFQKALYARGGGCREFWLAMECACSIERATNAQRKAAHIMRDMTLESFSR